MRPLWIVLIIALALFLLCLGVVCVATGLAGYFIIQDSGTTVTTSEPELPGLPTMRVTTRTPVAVVPTPNGQPADEGAFQTLQTLEEAVVPNADAAALAQRLGGASDIPATVPAWPDYATGDVEQFWVMNTDTNRNFSVDAELAYENEVVYFWIEEGVRYDQSAVRELAEEFADQIYPTNRAFFGSEWTPGIDNDAHINILYVRDIGQTVAGYFSSADSVHPLVHEYSNAREMFILSADNVGIDEPYIYGTLAHEFQHMIHWYRDANEDSWLNEGFSELASFLNGYDPGGFDILYIMNPDMQLTDWPGIGDSGPNYGASFLFVAYFLDRFGDEATKALVAHQDNSMDAVDAVLSELNITDPATGELLTSEDVFADWVLTNYLQSDSVGDGRFNYQRYTDAPQASDTDLISTCDGGLFQTDVHQYGVDYINITCPQSVTLEFQGATEVGVLPVDAYSGDFAFWSNQGDDSNMSLSREFDLTGVSGPVALTYRTWYDLETDYDYVFLVASTDGGDSWEIVETPSCTSEDPSGNSYGCGYNDTSGGWIAETVDLSQYAGQNLILRFEYVTDAAVNNRGLLLDDIAIPVIDYFTDFETDDGGWQAAGFARIENRLPQSYIVSLIRREGSQTTVEYLTLDDSNTLSLPLDFSGSLDQAILVVSGSTRFTRQLAAYQYELVP